MLIMMVITIMIKIIIVIIIIIIIHTFQCAESINKQHKAQSTLITFPNNIHKIITLYETHTHTHTTPTVSPILNLLLATQKRTNQGMG